MSRSVSSTCLLLQGLPVGCAHLVSSICLPLQGLPVGCARSVSSTCLPLHWSTSRLCLALSAEHVYLYSGLLEAVSGLVCSTCLPLHWSTCRLCLALSAEHVYLYSGLSVGCVRQGLQYRSTSTLVYLLAVSGRVCSTGLPLHWSICWLCPAGSAVQVYLYTGPPIGCVWQGLQYRSTSTLVYLWTGSARVCSTCLPRH